MDGHGHLQAAPAHFSPLRADTGIMVPVSIGALLWRLEDALGLSIAVKTVFSLEQSPMRPTSAEPIHPADVRHPTSDSVVAPSDLVPRKGRGGGRRPGNVDGYGLPHDEETGPSRHEPRSARHRRRMSARSDHSTVTVLARFRG
jgi:hypothetical protein